MLISFYVSCLGSFRFLGSVKPCHTGSSIFTAVFRSLSLLFLELHLILCEIFCFGHLCLLTPLWYFQFCFLSLFPVVTFFASFCSLILSSFVTPCSLIFPLSLIVVPASLSFCFFLILGDDVPGDFAYILKDQWCLFFRMLLSCSVPSELFIYHDIWKWHSPLF